MKTKVAFLMLLTSVLSISTLAQRSENLWYLGYDSQSGFPWGGTSINFSSGSSVIVYDSLREMNFYATEAILCDTFGSPKFYTNGIYLANSSGQFMQNGDSLNPSTMSFQSRLQHEGLLILDGAIILPANNGDSLYFLIHEANDDIDPPYPFHLYYTQINVNRNAGLGSVLSKNNIFFQDTMEIGQMVTCKHANGRDWWIVIPEKHNYIYSNYYFFLLDPSGIHFDHSQVIGKLLFGSGQAEFSRDGTKYASYDASNDLEVYDFDRCSGYFSNARHVAIADSMFGFGVSFSPNGQLVYASSGEFVYQFNLNSSNLSDYDTVAIWDGTYSPSPPFATLFAFQNLAPDGYIYISTGSGTFFLHKIISADSLGQACDFQQHSVSLPTFNYNSLPNYPNYSLGPVVGSICDSLTTGIPESHESLPLKLSAYPNPATNELWVNYDFPYQTNGFVELCDIQGRVLYKQGLYWSSKQLLLHVDTYSRGLYLLKISCADGRKKTVKVMLD